MKSHYGDRDTAGTTYLKAQKNSTEGLTLGEVSAEMARGLVDDLNETIQSNPFEGRPFYINVVEERDLQMKNAFKRRMFKSLYRPYPEDNTLVFHVQPKENKVYFCWDVPHHSEFPNIISNEHLYDRKYIARISEWLRNDLSNFGYIKVSMSSSQVEGYDEKTINKYRQSYAQYCESIEMDPQACETEKKLGFFWIPNKCYKDEDISTLNQPKIILTG